MSNLILKPNFKYTDRESKLKFVAEKYQNILKGRVLDIGADQMYLKKYLAPDVEYVGTGLGDHPDQIVVDLEKTKLPFEEKSFDCVMCLDVLEHIETIHDVFDQICKISKEWVLISLPNPWSDLFYVLTHGPYKPGKNTKYYGLPVEKELDRHKWFFSGSEANEFVINRGKKAGFEVYDYFVVSKGEDGLRDQSEDAKQKIIEARKLIFHESVNFLDLYQGTNWWVLRRK